MIELTKEQIEAIREHNYGSSRFDFEHALGLLGVTDGEIEECDIMLQCELEICGSCNWVCSHDDADLEDSGEYICHECASAY